MMVSRTAAARRTLVGATAIALVAGLNTVGVAGASPLGPLDSRSAPAAPAASRTVARGVDAPVPELRWMKCRSRFGGTPIQCAQAKVPMDYDRPFGAKTTLALARVRASEPSKRIGTLFVNPGGPGGSAVDFVPAAAALLGRHTRKRFDVVGIDPRGVAGSAPLICRDPTPGNAPPPPSVAFPRTPREITRWLRFDGYLRRLCATRSRPILDHMSTADTARDMDLIRQALGDKKLNYYGISYGTYLGATYAAMFPDNIRAMVVDGVLDPVAWATGRGKGRAMPFSSRLRSGKGAWLALTSAFAECDRVGKNRCVLAGHAAQTWNQVVGRLKRGPVEVGPGFELRYSDVVGTALGALYSRSSYRFLMRFIAAAHDAIFGPPTARAAADPAAAYQQLKAAIKRADVTRPYGYGRRYYAAFNGVACADSVNPANPRAWIRAASRTDHRSPWFGAAWTWVSSTCAGWPGSSADAFRGPFRVKTSAPVLIVGNVYDPATPISGARRLNSLLPGSRMLTLNGWGHGALGESSCVTKRMQRYLVQGALPLAGKVCKPDKQLFPRRAPG